MVVFVFLIHWIGAKWDKHHAVYKETDLVTLKILQMILLDVGFCRADAEQHQSSEVVDECEREG